MKRFEIGLTEPQFALLREANLYDTKARSLESFARDALLAGLTQIAVRDCGQRQQAVDVLVNAGAPKRRKL